MDGQRKHLVECFSSIATAYTFITSNSELLSTSVATVQSLANGLGKAFTLQDLIHCSIISPELIELEQSNSIKLIMPVKKRKRKKVDWIKEMTMDLVKVFNDHLDVFIKKHGDGFIQVLQSRVGQPAAELAPKKSQKVQK